MFRLTVGPGVLFAQAEVYQNPLRIPPEFSGSFAELRNHHFHGGLDFKTQQKEGLPVYAVTDGKLSRVVVSGTGYGRAIYISHNNGMMSVYAHLSAFIPKIEKVIEAQQYQKQVFEIDLSYPESLYFKKGDLIGYSGNSGSSGGPHLHFELRNRNGENALNPFLYGYPIKDNISPTISTLAIYPSGQFSLVEGSSKPLHLPVHCSASECIASNDTFRVFGQIAFGIEAIDKANGSANELGLYAFKLFINEELKFAWKLDGVLFSQTRYINAFIDYAHYDSTGKRIQWTFRLPANRLNIYEKVNSNGVFSFVENGLQNVRIEASDVSGNTSSLNFVLRVDDALKDTDSTSNNLPKQGKFFSHAVSNSFETDEIKISIPSTALYEPIYFNYRSEHSDLPFIYSNIHHVHHSGTPLHTGYSLKIRPTRLPESLENKALIGSWSSQKQKWVAEGGYFKDGLLLLNIRKFSIFAICIDTVKPILKPIHIANNEVPASQSEISFLIEDDFSGIGKYTATIDEKWFLMEYDVKTKTLKGRLNERLSKGEHFFRLTVSDKKNNTTTYQAKIIR